MPGAPRKNRAPGLGTSARCALMKCALLQHVQSCSSKALDLGTYPLPGHFEADGFLWPTAEVVEVWHSASYTIDAMHPEVLWPNG